MTEENKKDKVHFLSEKKKNLLLNLDLINHRLDVYRTNINIISYNFLENDRIKDSQLPSFDFEGAKKILNLFGELLNGTIKDYNDINQQILSKNSYGDVNKTSIEEFKKEKDNKFETYDKFGGVYPSEYANPNSKYFEGDK